MFREIGGDLGCPRPVPGNQMIQIVAVGTVGTKGFLIKQALDATAEANLIGMLLEAHRPAHLAMPASAEKNNSGAR